MMKKRPVNLNLFSIHFPVTAWVSILHRLSGFFVFLFIPLLLWMLQSSLNSEAQFIALSNFLRQGLWIKSIVWIGLGALFYHFVAGLRHLLMDLRIGESKREGKIGAWMVLGISAFILATMGYWVW